jgi:hypothetical protein
MYVTCDCVTYVTCNFNVPREKGVNSDFRKMASVFSRERAIALARTCVARLRRPGRFGFGLFLVLLVVLIWVGSSALIQYVFKDTNFNRPFFLTYFSTGLFTVYLGGFACLPWKFDGTHRGAVSKDAMVIKHDKNAAAAHTKRRPMAKSAAGRGAPGADDATVTETDLESFCGPSDDEAIRTMAKVPENIPLLTVRDTTAGKDTTNNTTNNNNVAARSAESNAIRLDDDDDNINDDDQENDAEPSEPLTTKQVARFALFFAPLWFIANLTFNWSLALTSVSSTTIISSSSCPLHARARRRDAAQRVSLGQAARHPADGRRRRVRRAL